MRHAVLVPLNLQFGQMAYVEAGSYFKYHFDGDNEGAALDFDKDEKTLTIAINRLASGIRISIEDNGVGRLKANKRKTESKGISLTKERIELFNYNRKYGHIALHIIDLYDNRQVALGTRVELILIDKEKIN